MATEANVAAATPEKKIVTTNVSKDIITDLKNETIGVSIHKIVRRNDDGREYFLMSATNLATRGSITLSASVNMIEKFDLGHIIREGNFNTEVEKPLYLNVEVTHIPNDGKRYGYVTDEGVKEYRNAGTYIFRNVKEPVDGSVIRAADAAMYANAYHAKGFMEEAKTLFAEFKGRPYVPGVNTDDDAELLKLYRIAKG